MAKARGPAHAVTGHSSGVATGTLKVRRASRASIVTRVAAATIFVAACTRPSPEMQAELDQINKGIAESEWRRTPQGRAAEADRLHLLAEESQRESLRQEYEFNRAEALRLSVYRPSDVAECRSRGNAAFGDIILKMMVMNDCLRARDLRRRGQ